MSKLWLRYGIVMAASLVLAQALYLLLFTQQLSLEWGLALASGTFLLLGWGLRRFIPKAVGTGTVPPARHHLGTPTRIGAVPELTAREREVLAELAAGHTDREIAEHLFVSLTTVKTHTRNLYSKLGVQRRTQAVAVARQKGWIPA